MVIEAGVEPTVEVDPICEIADQEMARINAEKAEGEEGKDANDSEGSGADLPASGEEKTNLSDEDNGAATGGNEKPEGDEPNEETEDELTDEDAMSDKTKTKINRKFERLTKKNKEQGEAYDAKIAELEGLIKAQKNDVDNRLNPPEKTAEATVKKTLLENKTKFLTEDLSKPFDERREMTDEDLEQFMMDEPAKAQKWIVRYEMRIREDTAYLFDEAMNVLVGANSNRASDTENNRVAQANTDVDFVARGNELFADGKNAEEIVASLRKEFPIFVELEAKDPKRYKTKNGFELMIQDYRAAQSGGSKKPGQKPAISAEDAEKLRLEGALQEKNRQQNVDEGTGPDVGRGKVTVANLTDLQKRAAKMADMSEQEYVEALNRQKKESHS